MYTHHLETERVEADVSFCFVKLSKMESTADQTNNYFANCNELEVLVVSSIQTLKRGNKDCGKEEVYRLVNDSLSKYITQQAEGIFKTS